MSFHNNQNHLESDLFIILSLQLHLINAAIYPPGSAPGDLGGLAIFEFLGSPHVPP